MASNDIQFIQYQDFAPSLKKLMQKGGKFQKAGERVLQVLGAINQSNSHEDAFRGLTVTNHGESRIAHCVKYDLTGYARLVTAHANNLCLFLFAGDHETVDAWLDRNRGLDFVARHTGEPGSKLRIDPVFKSDTQQGQHGLIHSVTDWMSNGPVIALLPERNREKLLAGLDNQLLDAILLVESDTPEDRILELTMRIEDPDQAEVVLDVLLALRESNLVKAKTRIDLFEREARPLDELNAVEATKIVSGETTVRMQDVDPVLFEHFVRTADFKKWMLYLHPQQREFVERDFSGPTRLAGVSGSGKTCVVIHRALRLARQSADRKVLVLTLNEALARLITELVDSDCGSSRPANLSICSVFDLCRDKLITFEPAKAEYYGKKTIRKNAYAESEHIDEIWDEYFHCRNNNNDADVLFDVVRTLNVRNIFPRDYVRQELDYVRSAFAPAERHGYLQMERKGRVIALEQRYREMVLTSLDGWEQKMKAVGAIDDTGIVTALYQHLDKLTEEFDHVLVDEIQDLGTLELRIIRCLTRQGPNDLFLCGDSAQSVQTKFVDLKAAQIDLPPARSIKLHQNYRNSRQILTAAHTVLMRSFELIPKGTTDLEILSPEYANFTSARPLLLEAESVASELAHALVHVNEMFGDDKGKKACIALCGYAQSAIEELSGSLEIPALSGSVDLSSGTVFLSDLEQTKGFEFDLMIVLNCCDEVIPHPELPEHESFRELCKLYVALTRAKTDLVVSFHGKVSRFISQALEHFNAAPWSDHVETAQKLDQINWPRPALQSRGDVESWNVSGKEFIRSRDAVGLSQVAQEEILLHVTAKKRFRTVGSSSKQIEWGQFGEFLRAMNSARARHTIISDEVWAEFSTRFSILENTIEQPLESQNAAKYEKVRLFRHEGLLKFSSSGYTAHALASLMVAQMAPTFDQIEVGKPMSYEILEHLIPRQVIAELRSARHIRVLNNRSDQIALTKAGLDTCLSLAGLRQAGGQDVVQSLSKTTIEEIEASKEMILNGRDVNDGLIKFHSKAFTIKTSLDDAGG